MSDFTDCDDATTLPPDLDDAALAVGVLRVLLDRVGEALGLAEAGR